MDIYQNIELKGSKIHFEVCDNPNIEKYDLVNCLVVLNNLPVKNYIITLEHFKSKDKLFYDERLGTYVLLLGDIVLNHDISKKVAKYAYDVERLYSAQEHLKLFKNRMVVPDVKNNAKTSCIKYTFGVEYETSEGHIPQNYCFKHGLIPLRDGSIRGNEYATVVMKGASGLQLIKNQMECIEKYTDIDSDCSIHIHFGKLNTEPSFIYALYCLLYNIQDKLEIFLPKYTFHTSNYKNTGKDYCKKLPKLGSFAELYDYLDPNNKGFVDIYQPNNYDPDGKHKWQIPGRYHWVNFINLLFYNKNKTLEFRFLQPTKNYKKLINWIYILNAIIVYCENTYFVQKEKTAALMHGVDLEHIIKSVYNSKISETLFNFMNQLSYIKKLQEFGDDYIGRLTFLDNVVIKKCVLDEE